MTTLMNDEGEKSYWSRLEQLLAARSLMWSYMGDHKISHREDDLHCTHPDHEEWWHPWLWHLWIWWSWNCHWCSWWCQICWHFPCLRRCFQELRNLMNLLIWLQCNDQIPWANPLLWRYSRAFSICQPMPLMSLSCIVLWLDWEYFLKKDCWGLEL